MLNIMKYKKNKIIKKLILSIVFVFSFSTSLFASTSSGTVLSSTYSTALVCQDAVCTPSLAHRINFKPTVGGSNPAITIDDTNGVDGYAWGEQLGWINFSAGNSATTTPGVQINPQTGNLYGYAWSQNSGWINFAPTNYGVSIDSGGQFTGYAWASGQNGGWIKFDCSGGATTTCVKTDWVPVSARTVVTPPSGGGGGGGGSGGSSIVPYTSAVASTTGAIGDITRFKTQDGLQNQKKDYSSDFRADINDSGIVDIIDYNMVMVAWGKTSNIDTSKPKVERCSLTLAADVNCDGGVDALDFNLVMVYWGQYIGEQGTTLKNKILKQINSLLQLQ
jgi:hypothetical protein